MKFYLHEPDKNKHRCYTYKALTYLLSQQHQLMDIVDKNTLILVSIEDITSLDVIRKAKKQFPQNILIAGGHLSKIACKAMSIFADIVWIGHIFQFLDCTSLDDIYHHPSAYWHGKQSQTLLSYNAYFDKLPVFQVDTRRFYYWYSVGCSRKCKFCMTSWTEQYQQSSLSSKDVERIKINLKGKGTLKLISNEYSTELGDEQVQDILLTDYIIMPMGKGHKKIRCGVEFPNENTRAKLGKSIPDEAITTAILKAKTVGHDLHFFCITGINTQDEWLKFIDYIPHSDKLQPRIFFKFTNLEYQQKTPLWKQVDNIDFNLYYDKDFSEVFFRTAAYKNKQVRVLPLKYPAHAIWRILMSNVANIDEYHQIYKLSSCKDKETLIKTFYDFKPWKNDLSRILTSITEIKKNADTTPAQKA